MHCAGVDTIIDDVSVNPDTGLGQVKNVIPVLGKCANAQSTTEESVNSVTDEGAIEENDEQPGPKPDPSIPGQPNEAEKKYDAVIADIMQETLNTFETLNPYEKSLPAHESYIKCVQKNLNAFSKFFKENADFGSLSLGAMVNRKEFQDFFTLIKAFLTDLYVLDKKVVMKYKPEQERLANVILDVVGRINSNEMLMALMEAAPNNELDTFSFDDERLWKTLTNWIVTSAEKVIELTTPKSEIDVPPPEPESEQITKPELSEEAAFEAACAGEEIPGTVEETAAPLPDEPLPPIDDASYSEASVELPVEESKPAEPVAPPEVSDGITIGEALQAKSAISSGVPAPENVSRCGDAPTVVRDINPDLFIEGSEILSEIKDHLAMKKTENHLKRIKNALDAILVSGMQYTGDLTSPEGQATLEVKHFYEEWNKMFDNKDCKWQKGDKEAIADVLTGYMKAVVAHYTNSSFAKANPFDVAIPLNAVADLYNAALFAIGKTPKKFANTSDAVKPQTTVESQASKQEEAAA